MAACCAWLHAVNHQQASSSVWVSRRPRPYARYGAVSYGSHGVPQEPPRCAPRSLFTLLMASSPSSCPSHALLVFRQPGGSPRRAQCPRSPSPPLPMGPAGVVRLAAEQMAAGQIELARSPLRLGWAYPQPSPAPSPGSHTALLACTLSFTWPCAASVLHTPVCASCPCCLPHAPAACPCAACQASCQTPYQTPCQTPCEAPCERCGAPVRRQALGQAGGDRGHHIGALGQEGRRHHQESSPSFISGNLLMPALGPAHGSAHGPPHGFLGMPKPEPSWWVQGIPGPQHAATSRLYAEAHRRFVMQCVHLSRSECSVCVWSSVCECDAQCLCTATLSTSAAGES